MAIEAGHLNLFPSPNLFDNTTSKNMLNSTGNSMNNNNPVYATTNPIQLGVAHFPTAAQIDSLLPFYNNSNNLNMMASEQPFTKSTAVLCNNNNPLPPAHHQNQHQRPVSAAAVAALKDDSGLTFNNSSCFHLPVKRNRDSSMVTSCAGANNNNNNNNGSILSVGRPVTSAAATGRVSTAGRCVGNTSGFSFLGEDLSLQMMQSQLEMDRMISLHMEKVRIEMENRRRKQLQSIIDAVEQAIVKRLRDKEDQIDKIGKINWALEERIKSLYMENQIWRDLAQTNEATANALRSNLEQVLAQANINNNNNLVYANANATTNLAATAAAAATSPRLNMNPDAEDGDVLCGGRLNMAEAEEAESCCGSTEHGDDDDDEDEVEGGRRWKKVARREYENNNNSKNSRRMCRRCGGMESSVLLLPCRHLCVCAGCGPYVDTCPICNSAKNASVHVNLS